MIRKLGTDGKDSRIARELNPADAQHEKPLHVAHACMLGAQILRMTKRLPFIKSGSQRQFQALGTDPAL